MIVAPLALGASVAAPSASLGTADTTAPQLMVAGELVDRGTALDHLGLLFDDQLDPTSMPAPSDFSFYVLPDAPTPTPFPPISSPVAVTFEYEGFVAPTDGVLPASGLSLLRLDLGTTYGPTDHVYLRYTPGAHRIRDLSGNEAAGFDYTEVLAITGDFDVSAGFVDDGAGPNHLLAIFSSPFSTPLPPAGAFSVKVNGGPAVQATSIADRLPGFGIGVLDLTLPVTIASTDSVTWSYGLSSPALTYVGGMQAADVTDAPAYVTLPAVPSRTTVGGTDVTVAPPDSTTGTSPVTINFASVTDGVTTVASSPTGPVAPAGFTFGDPPIQYELATTSSFTSATVCFSYDPTRFTGDEATLRLMHYEGGTWVDRTVGTVDTVNHRICGSVTSFSPFAIADRPPTAFSGFFSPVDNSPTINVVQAGSAVPVKFGLGGDRGLSIFTSDSPSSQAVACTSGAPIDVVEQTVSPGSATLAYDAGSDRYTYVWKTAKSWLGCRRLTLTFYDGTTQSASFSFK